MKRSRALSATTATRSGLAIGTDIVPTVRNWLATGIDAQILRSSVRVREMEEFSGGLKSPVVGRLTINVEAVIKQGSDELLLHERLMNGVNARLATEKSRQLQAAIFPTVVAVQRLAGLAPDRDHLMIQEALSGYTSVQTLLHRGGRSSDLAIRALRRAVPVLRFIHRTRHDDPEIDRTLPMTPDPFTNRLGSRLHELRREFSWLEAAFASGCTINGQRLPALRDVLEEIKRWYPKTGGRVDSRLAHGDPHLANVMARPHGNGIAVRWIDPNPLLGFTDPAYDWGKILHFAEPVGIAKESAEHISTHVRRTAGRPVVRTSNHGLSRKVEVTRRLIEKMIVRQALRAMHGRKDRQAVLSLAIASAHVGFAALEGDETQAAGERRALRARRQFALASTVDALARCWEAL